MNFWIIMVPRFVEALFPQLNFMGHVPPTPGSVDYVYWTFLNAELLPYFECIAITILQIWTPKFTSDYTAHTIM